MFGNFLYFIVALIIFITYQPPEQTTIPPAESIGLFLAMALFFGMTTASLFLRLKRQILRNGSQGADHLFDMLIARLSVMALIFYTVYIHGLGLPSLLAELPVFRALPTLLAILFIGIFIFHLAIIWLFAHSVHNLIQQDHLPRKEYISANISFSIPVLLPWFLLSIIADLIQLLPFSWPQQLLDTPAGQVVYFLIFLTVAVVFGPLLVQKYWGCKPLEPGYARSRIEAFSSRAGVEFSEILTWPLFGGRMLTAGVMGIIKKFRYILITPALLRFLSPEELDAVLAHEIGHVQKRHLLFYLFFFLSLMPLLLIFLPILNMAVYAAVISIKPLYDFIGMEGLKWLFQNPSAYAFILITSFYLYFRYIFGYFMRNFERQADIHVYHFMDSAAPLISSLQKIAFVSGQAADKPNWHHFSIQERIDYMRKCETNRVWVEHHNRKLKRSIALYLAAIVVLVGIVYQLEISESGKQIGAHLYRSLLEREIEKDPANADLYHELGDYYYMVGENFGAAVDAYRKSLALRPESPEVLNNLAWLYATCEDKSYRDPKQALVLARKAAELKSEAHILDTLAESYYVNGEYEKALEAERLALKNADGDRSHYERQLQKFREAFLLGPAEKR